MIGAQAKVPRCKRFVVRKRLMDELSKSAQTEPVDTVLLTYKLRFARFRQRKAQLFAAYALRLDHEPCRPREVSGCDPELTGVDIDAVKLRSDIVIDNRSARFFCCGCDTQCCNQNQSCNDSYQHFRSPLYSSVLILISCPDTSSYSGLLLPCRYLSNHPTIC